LISPRNDLLLRIEQPILVLTMKRNIYKSKNYFFSVKLCSLVQLLIVVFGLLTIMEFGNMMDQSHFPGSGIELDRYDEGNNTDLIWDNFKDGYFLDVVDKGRDDENASECSNFITQTQLSGATSGILRCQGTANAQKIQNCSNDMCVFLIIA
jgi:hypothetical protein